MQRLPALSPARPSPHHRHGPRSRRYQRIGRRVSCPLGCRRPPGSPVPETPQPAARDRLAPRVYRENPHEKSRTVFTKRKISGMNSFNWLILYNTIRSVFFCTVRGGDAAVANTEHLAHDGRAIREHETQRIRKAQYPLAHRLVWKDFIHQRGRAISHSPCPAIAFYSKNESCLNPITTAKDSP